MTVGVLAIGGACASDGADGPSEQRSDEIAVDAALMSGVGVLAEGCGPSASSGSGVAAGPVGHVVTVAHTVAGATSLTVIDIDGVERDARVVAFDPEIDLAVLAVDGLEATPLAVGDVQLGDLTLVRWSAGDGVTSRQVDVTQRLAITIDDIYGDVSVQRSGFEFTGNIVVGDSGGPIVSTDGAVIGIVYARSRSRASTAFATDGSEITALLSTIADQPVDNGACV